MKVVKVFKERKEVIKDKELVSFEVFNSYKKEKTMSKKISINSFKQSLSNISKEALQALVEDIEEKKRKRYEYNKAYRKRNPLTQEQKAKRYEYNKAYNARKKAEKDEILKAAKEAGLIK